MIEKGVKGEDERRMREFCDLDKFRQLKGGGELQTLKSTLNLKLI